MPRESTPIREKLRLHATVNPVVDGRDKNYDFSEDFKYYLESLTRAWQRLEGDSATNGQGTNFVIAETGVKGFRAS